jgi:hypothetical protein
VSDAVFLPAGWVVAVAIGIVFTKLLRAETARADAAKAETIEALQRAIDATRASAIAWQTCAEVSQTGARLMAETVKALDRARSIERAPFN